MKSNYYNFTSKSDINIFKTALFKLPCHVAQHVHDLHGDF